MKIILYLLVGVLIIGGFILIIIGTKGLDICYYNNDYFGNKLKECDEFKLNVNKKIYNENNLLLEEINYVNLVENGQFYYYNNGKLTGKGQAVNGELDGIIISYYEDGEIKQTRNYENGRLNGYYFEYYENGQIKEKGNYKDGKEIGIWTGYYENGNIQYIENYNNGKLDGEYFEYYENGNIREEGYYNNGKKTLFWDSYLEDGYNRNYIYYGNK